MKTTHPEPIISRAYLQLLKPGSGCETLHATTGIAIPGAFFRFHNQRRLSCLFFVLFVSFVNILFLSCQNGPPEGRLLSRRPIFAQRTLGLRQIVDLNDGGNAPLELPPRIK